MKCVTLTSVPNLQPNCIMPRVKVKPKRVIKYAIKGLVLIRFTIKHMPIDETNKFN